MDFEKLMNEIKTIERKKRLEKSLLFHGIFNIAFPFINILLTTLFIIFFTKITTSKQTMTILTTILLFSPLISSILAIIRSLKHIKAKNAKKSIYLSITSLFIYITIIILTYFYIKIDIKSIIC